MPIRSVLLWVMAFWCALCSLGPTAASQDNWDDWHDEDGEPYWTKAGPDHEARIDRRRALSPVPDLVSRPLFLHEKSKV